MNQACILLDKFILSSSSFSSSSSLDFIDGENDEIQRIAIEHDAALSEFRKLRYDDPFYMAVQENRFQPVKFMIQHRFNSDADDLAYRASETGNLELVKLLDNPTSVERCTCCTYRRIPARGTSMFDMTGCLTGACESKSMDIIDYLLETGKQIDQCSLDMICENGNIDILDRFIRHMTDTDDFSPLNPQFGTLYNPQFGTFLHGACYWNQTEIIKRLFIYGCDFTLTDGESKTPFQVAVDNNRTETIKLLTSLGITQ